MKNVIVYSTNTCPWCVRVKQYLSSKNVPFVEKKVDEDHGAMLEMTRRTGQQGVPVILVNDEVVVGFDRPRLDLLLSDGQAGGVTLGAAVADASTFMSKRGLVPIFGAYVGKVTPGSAAVRLGLIPGDVITEINMRPISNAEDVQKAMAGLTRGSSLSINYVRGENSSSASAIL